MNQTTGNQIGANQAGGPANQTTGNQIGANQVGANQGMI